jgi:hypothetical protein
MNKVGESEQTGSEIDEQQNVHGEAEVRGLIQNRKCESREKTKRKGSVCAE